MQRDLFQHFDQSEWPFVEQVLDWETQAREYYQMVLTPFLNPREQFIVQSVIGQPDDLKIESAGGFLDAENSRLRICSSYIETAVADFQLQLFHIDYPKKFATLTHGQIMGTLLGTGIQRNRLGDIVSASDANGQLDWQVVVDRELDDFLRQTVTRMGHTRVELVPIDLEEAYPANTEWEVHESSVSSFRLDTLLAEGFHFSRTKVKTWIENGAVKRNWLETANPAQPVNEYDILSLRGAGRMRLDAKLSKTKKGNEWIRYSIIKSK
ncbi:MAG: YlmH/Sll1252 family protein [Aerococcus sp.]|nr:YlmH/Sll1252 family protein [Aerococcus sp.]